VVDYKAAMSPLAKPSITKYTVSELYNAEALRNISSISTFYIPPKEFLPLAPYAEKLVFGGHKQAVAVSRDVQVFPALGPTISFGPVPPAYGPAETKAIAAIKTHTVPPQYKLYSASPAMQKAVESLSLSLKALKRYQASPSIFAASTQGLNPHEQRALASGSPAKISAVMRGDFDEVIIFFSNLDIASEYS
jgi:hypothetical protein